MRLAILSTVLSLLGGILSPSMLAAETCVEWVAKAVSVQGNVEVRRAGEAPWTQVQWRDTFCHGDIIWVRARSRLAIVAQNGSNYRIDENTTITITQPEPKQTFLLNLRAGAAYFFSRLPRSLNVITPFANAGVEGTEFFVKVERDQTFLSVFEGRVAVTNPAGSLTLASSQSAIAKAEQAPTLRVVVRPRDAVQWALHYPPIIDFRPADFPGEAAWQALVRQSIPFYWQGDLPSAFASIAAVPSDIRDPRFFTYRAALLLTVGRVEKARVDIERALALEPRNSHALALQSIIAVAQNRKDEALQLATEAVALEPTSSAARVALSYAQQARFDLPGALASLKAAVTLPPENALAWARLAELWLSVGNLKRALNAARRASALNSQVARTQTVLGFAFLTQIKIRNAKNTFERAIQLDQTDPLSRLGLGLAQIRQGKLKEGRGEIEIAASLDPNNSIIRSYLGKAYFEEKRDKLARNQFATAKSLDPQDPTPWFYDAIHKQTVNRPVEALQDLQKSIELNDNRAVYRSRLLLDEDIAARSASLGSIYTSLGFEQRALVEGWYSLTADPANHSAHRFLADSYASRPRHEIARVSELLQTQLLQPLNINNLQPQLVEDRLNLLTSAGPSNLSFNEFNPLFMRNRAAFLGNLVVGNHETIGDDVVLSGIYGPVSVSLGQFHFQGDGFRPNNDIQHDIFNAFVQGAISPKVNLQAEYRWRQTEQGDLQQNFDPNNFSPTLRRKIEQNTYRVGARISPAVGSDVIISYLQSKRKDKINDSGIPTHVRGEDEGYQIEGQYIHRQEGLNAIFGGGRYEIDVDNFFQLLDTVFPEQSTREHNYGYFYMNAEWPSNNIIWTGGFSYDDLKDRDLRLEKINPKFGIQWSITNRLRLRLAYIQAVKRALLVNQTIEPTQVAGFNQFFDDPNSTESELYGIAVDSTLTDGLYGGAEYSYRGLKVPTAAPVGGRTDRFDWIERLYRGYLYWTPHRMWAFSFETEFEQFNIDRDDPSLMNEGGFQNIETLIVPLGARFFHPSGFFTLLGGTFVWQKIDFPPLSIITKDEDNFILINASIGYRLPKRRGIFSLEVRNLFNRSFSYQDLNIMRGGEISTSRFVPERTVFVRMTFNF